MIWRPLSDPLRHHLLELLQHLFLMLLRYRLLPLSDLAVSQKEVMQQMRNINSRKSERWSAVPVPCLSRLWLKFRGEQGSGPKGVDDL